MKKLEEIKKENIYKVPDRYFDELPMRIQDRITGDTKSVLSPVYDWRMAVKIAVPAFILVFAILIGVFIRNNNTYQDVDTILAQVSSEDMIAYLQSTDISIDDILNEIQYEEIADEILQENFLLDDDELSIDLYDELMIEYGNNEI